jgi:hypothetical protein
VHDPVDGQAIDVKETLGFAAALEGTGASVRLHVPLVRRSIRPWVLLDLSL